ncbi:MAG: DUF1385 domain-containing protein [Calditrichaeota bacterium]|nr:MAG: DUF1385 domain-containing protein [Calditrichota bacterium]
MPEKEFQKEDLAVGGQALIEGVMMRSSKNISIAVRNPQDEIVVKKYPFVSLSKKVKILGLPIIRGAVGLFESLKIGTSALNFSAEIAGLEEDDSEPTTFDKILGGAITIFSVLFGIGLFMFLPLQISEYLIPTDNQFIFNLLAGGVRLSLFLLYLWGISMLKDIKRIFEYHGAEHKSIYAFETEQKMDVKTAKRYTTLHPRCGTSFLLVVAIQIILIFSVIDSVIVGVLGHPYENAFERFLVHFPFMPVVAGFSFEFLKFSGKYRDNPIVKVLIQPGLWLQKITTNEPDEDQLEVAIVALRSSLDEEFMNCPEVKSKVVIFEG